jgi:hypothetical protein
MKISIWIAGNLSQNWTEHLLNSRLEHHSFKKLISNTAGETRNIYLQKPTCSGQIRCNIIECKKDLDGYICELQNKRYNLKESHTSKAMKLQAMLQFQKQIIISVHNKNKIYLFVVCSYNMFYQINMSLYLC